MKKLLGEMGISEPELAASTAPESASASSCLDSLFTSIHTAKENIHVKEKARIKELMNANGFAA